MSMNKLTANDVKYYQGKIQEMKNTGKFTANNFKLLGRDLRDTFGLTDMQAIDILNGKQNEVIEILAEQENKNPPVIENELY
jgi:hypothetical protein